MVCVGIYTVLVQNIAVAIWECMGYTVLLCLLTTLYSRISPSTHTTIRTGCFGQIAEKLLQKLSPFKEKIQVVSFLPLHPASFYAILMVCTPRKKGSDPHSHHKRKFAHEEADSDRLREAVFGKGLQADHAGGNQRKGRCVFQPVPEHFPRQGRRIDGTGGVHV